MTPEEISLDPDFFLVNQPLMLYRIARARYANLSGVGAAQYPGRWNRLGQKAIYTSTEKSLAVLEMLVHIPKDEIPSNLALLKIRVSGRWGRYEKNVLDDQNTRGSFLSYPSIGAAKNAFNKPPHVLGEASSPFAVAVPSVIVPVWNVVLYPQGVGFWDHVALESVETFEFDPRLFS